MMSNAAKSSKNTCYIIEGLSETHFNAIIVRDPHSCFEKSKEISRRMCRIEPIFQRSFVGEGEANIRALAGGNERLFTFHGFSLEKT